MSNLPSASDLKLEREKKLAKFSQTGFTNGLERAIRRIKETVAHGGTEFNDLTFPDAVVKELEAKGYKVKFLAACGMGDMDSHTVSWE